jgi:REDY-like protein HapK
MIVFFMNRLKEGVDPKKYERWVREFDYAQTRKMKSVDRYRVSRVGRSIKGRRPYDYVELVEINDPDLYEKELRGPVGRRIISQWRTFVRSSDAFYCDVVGADRRLSSRSRDKS